MTQLPFIPREKQIQLVDFNLMRAGVLGDSIFDGIPISKGVRAQNWKPELKVHNTVLLSTEIDSTRNLVGSQVSVVRDEVRRKTWATFIESGRLILAEIVNTNAVRKVLSENNAWRSHLVLDKFSGQVLVVWISKDDRRNLLWCNEIPLPTAASNPDFPFMDISQASIGFVQKQPAPFGLLTYKDRDTGKLYIRRYEKNAFGDEQELKVPRIIGGASLAISNSEVLIRIDALDGERIIPMFARSSDSGMSFSAFEPVELPFDDSFRVIPSGLPVVDHHGFFHVPLAVTNNKESILVNAVLDEALVETIRLPGNLADFSKIAAERFPKNTGSIGTLARFGNGVTDGLGLIAVMELEGHLFTSNSQAGGIHFPQAEHLNHEMPKIAAYDSTECYTGGLRANIVSMDYVYLEADPDTKLPYSGELHFETWEMPLPEPILTAKAKGTDVSVEIESDAHFYPGQTVFEFDDPAVNITGVDFVNERSATILTDSTSLVGKRLSFEARTLFYHHAGSVVVE
jgi:hypothetical protein